MSNVTAAVTVAVITLTAGHTVASPRAAVYVDAGGKARLRAQLQNAVADHMDVIEIDGQAVRQGVNSTSVSASMAAPIREAGERAGADAVVMARVNRQGRSRQTLRVVVLEVHSGRILEDRSVTIGQKKRSKRRRRKRWVVNLNEAKMVLGDALGRVQTGESGAPQQEGGRDGNPRSAEASGDDPSWASGSSDDDSSGGGSMTRVEERAARRRGSSLGGARGAALAIVGGGFTMSGREHAYEAPATSNLRPYSVLGAPGFAFDATLYPLARHRSLGALQDVGFEAEYGQALGLVSSPADNEEVLIQTTWQRWSAGAVMRFEFSPLLLRLRAGVGALNFVFTPEGNFPAVEELPQVAYMHIRAGADSFLDLGSLGLLLGAEYLHMLTSGYVGDYYFPNSSKFGIQGHVGATIPIVWGIELRVLGRYTHVLYSDLGAVKGDEYVATRAMDRYFGVETGFSYVY